MTTSFPEPTWTLVVDRLGAERPETEYGLTFARLRERTASHLERPDVLQVAGYKITPTGDIEPVGIRVNPLYR